MKPYGQQIFLQIRAGLALLFPDRPTSKTYWCFIRHGNTNKFCHSSGISVGREQQICPKVLKRIVDHETAFPHAPQYHKEQAVLVQDDFFSKDFGALHRQKAKDSLLPINGGAVVGVNPAGINPAGVNPAGVDHLPPNVINWTIEDSSDDDEGNEVPGSVALKPLSPSEVRRMRAGYEEQSRFLNGKITELREVRIPALKMQLDDTIFEGNIARRKLETDLKKSFQSCPFAACDSPPVGLRCAHFHGLCAEHSTDTVLGMVIDGHHGTCAYQIDGKKCCQPFNRESLVQFCSGAGLGHELSLIVQRETTEQAERRSAEEKERLLVQRAEEPGLRGYDIERDVNLKRPCCGFIVPNFEACLALECDNAACSYHPNGEQKLNNFFCGICLVACNMTRVEGHTHIQQCSVETFGKKIAGEFGVNYFGDFKVDNKRKVMRDHYSNMMMENMKKSNALRDVMIINPLED